MDFDFFKFQPLMLHTAHSAHPSTLANEILSIDAGASDHHLSLRFSMKGKFDVYLLWSFTKKLIS